MSDSKHNVNSLGQEGVYKSKINSEAGVDTIKGIETNKLLNAIQRTGVQYYGSTFLLREGDYPVIRKLLIYFLGDEELSEEEDIDLNKGVLLFGPIGSGKTSLMTLLKSLLGLNVFYIRTCRDISFEFHSEGFDVIDRYSKKSFQILNGASVVKNYCFDDLGLEKNMKRYGNDCNVMREIILSRYELFINTKMLTHFTTNQNLRKIETRYGEDVLSRLSQMVNFISFREDTPDKRRVK